MVLATAHVTVRVSPTVQTSGELGCVTAKGPLLLVTLTCILAEFTAPPPARLSRAVTWKFMVRVVVGSDSPNVDVSFRMSDNLGKVRAGVVVGLKERKIGRLPSSVLGGDCVPRSYSSQAKVNASPFASLPARGQNERSTDGDSEVGAGIHRWDDITVRGFGIAAIAVDEGNNLFETLYVKVVIAV